REGVDVRHQAVAQPVVVGERVVDLGAAGRQVVDLAVWQLAVRAEHGAEGAELEPARVELAPFLEVRRRRMEVARLRLIAADIHGPVGEAREREADPGGDLIPEVRPARRNIAAPDRRPVALQTGEARAGKDEGPGVRTRGEVASVDT